MRPILRYPKLAIGHIIDVSHGLIVRQTLASTFNPPESFGNFAEFKSQAHGTVLDDLANGEGEE